MLDQRRAIQLYLENRDKFPKGMTESDAISLIRRSGGLPAGDVPVAPVPAPAATMPVPTPDQVAPPAAPEQAAPPPPAYKNEYELALEAYNAANPIAAAAAPAKKGPVDYAARAREAMTEGERKILERNAAVAAGAKIDPKIEELLTKREARTDEEIANIDKDRQQAIWMAIAQAGMKMAQSQSPYFLQALASGMEAGLNGYSEDKAKAAEKKARLQDAKEEVALKRYELLDKARDKAINLGRMAKQDLAAEQTLAKGALSNILGEETIDEQIIGAGLENEAKREQILTARHNRYISGQQLELARRKGQGGGGGTVKTSDVKAALSGAVSDNKLIAMRLADFTNPPSPQEKKELAARRAQNNDTIRRANSLLSGKIGISDSNPLGLPLG